MEETVTTEASEAAETAGSEQALPDVPEKTGASQADAGLVRRHWAEVDRIYAAWTEQAEQLQQLFPDFDLRAELTQPGFARMLSSGVPVRLAYQAMHSEELLLDAMRFAARAARQQMASAVASGAGRPGENGLSGGAAARMGSNVAAMSSGDISRYCKMVENGIRVSFG